MEAFGLNTLLDNSTAVGLNLALPMVVNDGRERGR